MDTVSTIAMRKEKVMARNREVAPEIANLTDDELASAIAAGRTELASLKKASKAADQEYDKLREAHRIAMEPHFKAMNDANRAMWEQERTIESLDRERRRREAKFQVGDIVADDMGVQYRIHEVRDAREWDYRTDQYVEAGTLFGVRLSKTGIPVGVKPRPIVSSKPLVKVEIAE